MEHTNLPWKKVPHLNSGDFYIMSENNMEIIACGVSGQDADFILELCNNHKQQSGIGVITSTTGHLVVGNGPSQYLKSLLEEKI